MGLLTPFPFQKEGVLQIEQVMGNRALLGDEMGLGKTLQCLWWLRRQRTTQLLPAVVVCPYSLKWNWEHEATHHCGLRATVLEGRRPPKRKGLVRPDGVYILNYDIVSNWIDWLLELNPQAVAVDECQKIKNQEIPRTMAVKELCHGRNGILMMSGTPIVNRPSEFFTALNILRPERFPSFFEYAVEYCEPVRKPWGWEYNGARNLDKLHAEVEGVMIRRYKKDVLPQLPAKTRSTVLLPIRDPGEYKKAKDDFMGWLKGVSPHAAKRAGRASGLVKIGYLKRLAAKLKMKAALDWVQEFLDTTNKKIVLFAHHTAAIEAARRRWADCCVVVSGKVKKEDRKTAAARFQNDAKCRVFIGSIEAAAEGLTLTAADTVAFLELDWRPGLMMQAEDRIHRIGQINHAIIYYLIAHGTIEEKLCQILQDKQSVINAVLDGGAYEELDVYDLLIDSMSQERTAA